MLNRKSASVQLITLLGHRLGVRLFFVSRLPSCGTHHTSLVQVMHLQYGSVSKFCRQSSHASSVFNARRTLRDLQRHV